jgi:hypothetical protein
LILTLAYHPWLHILETFQSVQPFVPMGIWNALACIITSAKVSFNLDMVLEKKKGSRNMNPHSPSQ